MARLLVRAKAPFVGDISVAVPDDHQFGAMEDIEQYRSENGDDGWPGDFVVVDLLGMSIAEALDLAAPVVTTRDGPIDEITGLPKQIATIHHNSKGVIDFDAMANTDSRRNELATNRRVTRGVGEVRDHITERTP